LGGCFGWWGQSLAAMARGRLFTQLLIYRFNSNFFFSSTRCGHLAI